MTAVTLYHNPRCSKSREALALLNDKGADITQVRYLEDAPSAEQYKTLIQQLGRPAHDLLRVREEEYKLANLNPNSSEADIIAALVTYPRLLERPIAVVGNKAVIGRPPETVLELLK